MAPGASTITTSQKKQMAPFLRACFKTRKFPVQEGPKDGGRDLSMNTPREMSFREKGRLALLLLPYRPLRVCAVVAPSHPAFLAKTGAILFLKHALGLRLAILGLCGCILFSTATRSEGAEATGAREQLVQLILTEDLQTQIKQI